jgi:hypothetical protein
MSDGTSITTSFTVTIDGGAPLGPFDAGVGLAIAEFEASGQVVRVDVETSTGGNTGAVELEIYGSPGTIALPPPATAAPVATVEPEPTDGPGVAKPGGSNVARGARIVGVSSEFSSEYAGSNVVDGDPATEWSSAGDGDDAFIIIDLGEEFEIFGVGFHTREMTDGTSITLTFTVSVDGGSTYGPFEAGPGMVYAQFKATGGSVRIDVDTSTGGNTGAVEIEVYGEPTM